MKNNILITVFMALLASTIYADDLSLNDMEIMCGKKSWVDVNDYLVGKGWEYYNSSDSVNNGCKSIIWAENYSHYTDQASGWLYLHVNADDDSDLSLLSYRFFYQKAYSKFVSQLTKKGYTRTSSDIDDRQTIIVYSSDRFRAIISIQQEQDKYETEKMTVYEVSLLRKRSLLDYENGNKSYTDSTGCVHKYTLNDGKLDGQFTVYYPGGRLKQSLQYDLGRLSGVVKSYDEDGRLLFEAIMNDSVNCSFLLYDYDENGTVTVKTQGTAKCFNFYDEAKLSFGKDSKYTRWNYSDGKLTGRSELFGSSKYGGEKYYDENGNLVTVQTSSNDTLQGEYKHYDYDAAGRLYYEVSCFYKDGELEGKSISKRYLADGIYETIYRNYRNGKFDGAQKSIYHSNGSDQTYEDFTCSNGKKIGCYRNISYGDTVCIGCRNSDGKRNGLWTMYLDVAHSMDSTIRTIDTLQLLKLEQGYYVSETKHGNWYHRKWTSGYGNCQVDSFVFDNDQWKAAKIRVGDKTCRYSRDGLRVTVSESSFGVLTKKATYCITNDNLNELYDGEISCLFSLSNKDGDYAEFDSDGRIISVGSYQNGLKRGKWTYYYYAQNCILDAELPYANETYKTIDTGKPYKGYVVITEGDFRYQISVKKGKRNGYTLVFRNGRDKPIRKDKYKDGIKVGEKAL